MLSLVHFHDPPNIWGAFFSIPPAIAAIVAFGGPPSLVNLLVLVLCLICVTSVGVHCITCLIEAYDQD